MTQDIILVEERVKQFYPNRTPTFAQFSINVHPYPQPFLSAVSFTFDCEGPLGGGSNWLGDIRVIPLLADLFRRWDKFATWNIVGELAYLYPEIPKYIAELGHDLGGHGYKHDRLDLLSMAEQEVDIVKTMEAIERACGQRILGWRSPFGAVNEFTYEALIKKEFLWSSNLGVSLWGASPFYIGDPYLGILELPYDDITSDSMLLYYYELPIEKIVPLWLSRLRLLEMGCNLFLPIAHPVNLQTSNDIYSLFDELIERSINSGKIWIATCTELARRYNLLRFIKLYISRLEVSYSRVACQLVIENNGISPIKGLGIRLQGKEFKDVFLNSQEGKKPVIFIGNNQNWKGGIIWIDNLEGNMSYNIEFEATFVS